MLWPQGYRERNNEGETGVGCRGFRRGGGRMVEVTRGEGKRSRSSEWVRGMAEAL